jgi:hypothetical protein
MWSTWLCGAEPENRRFTGLFAFSAPHNILQTNMVAGVPPGTLSPCSKHYSSILGCPRAMPTDRWLRSEAHFCHTFKLRAYLAPLFCATQASCFWSLVCCPEKEAVRSRAAKSAVAPSAGRNVNSGEAAPEQSGGRRSVLIKQLVAGTHSWAGSKTHRRSNLPIRPN